MAELGVRALAGATLATVHADVVAAVARTLDIEFVKIVELQPDGTTARLVAGVGWAGGLVGTATITVGPDSQAGYALLSREPVLVEDLDTETRLHDPPLLRDHGVVSGISVILYGPGGRAYGVLGAHSRRPRRFSQDDVSFLQAMANVVSFALQRQQVEHALRGAHADAEAFAAQLQDQARELEQQTQQSQSLTEQLEASNLQLHAAAARAARLLAVSAGLSAASTREEVADVIFREGLVALQADAGLLAVVHTSDDSPTLELETVHTTGYPDRLAARYRRFVVTPGRPMSDAVLTRLPQLRGSWADWRDVDPDLNADATESGYEAFATVPVVSGSRVLAVLSASFRRSVTFDEATRTFLATLGEQCGLALERARAYDDARRARDASAFLAEAGQLLAASLDYATTLRTVAEAAVPRLGDWCAVDILRDPTAPTWPPSLERVATVHQDPDKLALGETLTTRYPTDWSDASGMAAVIRDGTPMFLPVITRAMIEARARDAEHLALLETLQFSSVIVVPLLARGHTIGALTLCHTESGRHYDATDLTLAQDLAKRAALAVDNARLYRDAERARQVAEEANRGKSQFLATMSHELRTPLNAIAGHVQLLELGLHGSLTDAQRHALDRVNRAQQHLLGLINDVLNYARLESGRVEYDLQPVRIRDVVCDVWPMVEPQITAKGLTCEVRLPDGDGQPALLVLADREKLAQILLNLLSNAIKFTPAARDGVPGRVVIEVRADPDAPARVQALVIDTGVGIAASKLETIFEPFVQVQSVLTREVGGTGLGLAISRDLARGMGGDLTAESTLDAGSTFTLTLPAA